MVHQQEFSVATSRHGEMHDITGTVAEIVAKSGIRTGLVNVFHTGSTGSVGVIEFEPGLEGDLPAMFDRLIPPSREYGHEKAWHDGNGHSHLQATLQGPSFTAPVAAGRPVLGTWQQIFFLEHDVKPRTRRIVVTVYGEG
ncbi:MAG: secondary thiamine-phosphate synthase enzyme YjbQ [Armatimonadota bacterium]